MYCISYTHTIVLQMQHNCPIKLIFIIKWYSYRSRSNYQHHSTPTYSHFHPRTINNNKINSTTTHSFYLFFIQVYYSTYNVYIITIIGRRHHDERQVSASRRTCCLLNDSQSLISTLTYTCEVVSIPKPTFAVYSYSTHLHYTRLRSCRQLTICVCLLPSYMLSVAPNTNVSLTV